VTKPLSAWAPVVAWAALIFSMSTDSMSADHTRTILWPIVHFFHPSISDEAFDVVHFVVRKLAHFSEYAVFAFLLDRALRLGSSIAPSRAPIAAVVAAVLYSLTDEGHQAFVASRGPSLRDCGVDASGAAFMALGLAFLRREKTG